MSKRHVLLLSLSLCSATACSKSEPQGRNVEYGDAVGIEFGDPTTGRFLAAVAAEKGHSPEKGVPALASALQEASRGCPSLANEAADQKSLPTLHLTVKNGKLQAMPIGPHDLPSAACMSKALDGKPTPLESPTPYELTIQLLRKKASE